MKALTPRERDILELVSRGFEDKEIGRLLGIHGNTVKCHMKNIYRHWGVHNRTEAAIEYLSRRGRPDWPHVRYNVPLWHP